MRFPLTRRKLIGRIFSVMGVAAVSAPAAAEYDGQADDILSDPKTKAQAMSHLTRARQVVERLASSAGAALVGFARPEGGGATSTVQRKLLDFPSITDFGAIADGNADNAGPIQRAIDALYDVGGGSLLIPAGTFRIASSVQLRTNVKLYGTGAASVLHLVNDRRGDAMRGEGRPSRRLSGIAIRDLVVAGDARFTGGKPSVINGSGIIFVHADDCDVTGVAVIGFSDNGITFLNGNRNSVTNCRVQQTAQGISFTASTMSVTGNVAIGNRISDTGEYNGLHLEGGFGGGANGEVCHTTLSGNTITNSWEAGLNIELAPHTSCVGNTVHRAGVGRTNIDMGIKVYGGHHSAICGNTVTDGTGDAIVVGANSGGCSVNGNTTAGNGGSLLLTDSRAQVSNDVAIGTNSFAEGDVRTSGNVRIRNRTTGLSFANRPSPDAQTLDWYEEGRFLPIVASGNAGALRDAAFTRIGQVVHVRLGIEAAAQSGESGIVIEGLPFPAAGETPLTTAPQSRDGRGDPELQASAVASGSQLMVWIARRSSANRTHMRDWTGRIVIAGQYLTTG